MIAAVPTRISEEAAAMLAQAPAAIGRFTIVGEIGRGSNGVVYEATDPVLGREVAIKLIPLSSEDEFRRTMEANFVREARAAAALNHPNIVTVFDAGKTENLAYIAMERLQGHDLYEQMASGPKLTDRQAAELAAQVADALDFAHQRGLIHRDVKPGNIFLSPTRKPKVLDFGVALAARSEVDASKSHPLVGTPNYMSPEQARGEPLDPRTDIFAVGAILYELVTGLRAFDGKTVDEVVGAVIQCRPKPVEALRRDLPPELVRIIHRAMAKAPADRYQSAGELRDDLLRFIGEGTAANGSAGNHGLSDDVEDAAGWLEIGLATLVIVGAIVGAWYATVESDRTRATGAQQVETPAAPPPSETPQQAAGTAGSGDGVTTATAGDVTKPVAGPQPAAPNAEIAPVRSVQAPAAVSPPDGTLALAVSPWGEVFVNGTSRGVAPPLSQLSLAPGSYTIEIRNSDNVRFTTRIDVKSGQTVSLHHRF